MTDRVRVGAIGAGWWATTNHFPILAARDDVELVGVCSLGAEHLTRVQSEFGFERTTEDFTELLDWPLDAVIVSTPHHLHFAPAAAALDRGLTTLIEKPMTLNASDAWDLVARSNQNQAPIVVPYGWNYAPFLEEAHRLLQDVGIGRIEHATVRMASPTKDFFSAVSGGVPTDMTGGLVGPDPETWQSPDHGGGYLHGQLTHAAALLFWLTDLRAAAVTARLSGPGAAIDLYDSLLVDYTSGIHGTFAGSATLPHDEKFQVDLQLFGSDGVLLVDVERERVELRRHDGGRYHVEIPANAGAYECVRPVEQFVEIAKDPAAINNSPGHVGARTVELLEAAHTAALTGATVPVDLTLGANG